MSSSSGLGIPVSLRVSSLITPIAYPSHPPIPLSSFVSLTPTD